MLFLVDIQSNFHITSHRVFSFFEISHFLLVMIDIFVRNVIFTLLICKENISCNQHKTENLKKNYST
jgi:hypothetical protein